MKQWHIWYIWNTYLSPHIRYGSLIYYNLNKEGMFDTKNAAFNGIQKIYNRSVKLMMNLPTHSANSIINDTLGGNAISNIIMKNYRSNAIKWELICENDLLKEKNQLILNQVIVHNHHTQ